MMLESGMMGVRCWGWLQGLAILSSLQTGHRVEGGFNTFFEDLVVFMK
jgi:hypothetical protein